MKTLPRPTGQPVVAVVTNLLTPFPAIVLGPNFDTHIRLPVTGLLSDGHNDITVWVFGEESPELRDRGMAIKWPKKPLHNEVAVSKRVSDFFGESLGGVNLTLPTAISVHFRRAAVDKLPTSLEARVSSEVFKLFKPGANRSYWVLATTQSVAIPIRLVQDSTKGNLETPELRGGALLRFFLGLGTESQVQLSPIGHVLNDRPTRNQRTVRNSFARGKGEGAQAVVAAVIRTKRRVSSALERSLHLLFGAPSVAVVSHPASLGDDTEQIVRLHPSLFSMLGISPGDEIFVEWGGRRTAAVAFEFSPDSSANTNGSNHTGHLQALVSAQIRFDLGMPRSSALELRRRVLPKVLDNINDAFIPAVSVLIGMISLGLTGPELVFAVLSAVYLSLLKVRVPKASPGQFV
jgi:hypothetical protein